MHLEKNTRVRIVSQGLIYSTYRAMAEKMQLRNFEFGHEVRNGQTGKILGSEFHHTNGSKLYAVRMDDTQRDIIIEYCGVEFYKKHLLEMDNNLFRI